MQSDSHNNQTPSSSQDNQALNLSPQHLLPLNATQLATWKRHPVSQLVLQFCADYAKIIEQQHTARWKSKTLEADGGEDEARGYMTAFNDLVALTPEAINNFYQPEAKKESKDGTDNKN